MIRTHEDCRCRNPTKWSDGSTKHWCMSDYKIIAYAWCEGAMAHNCCPRHYAYPFAQYSQDGGKE